MTNHQPPDPAATEFITEQRLRRTGRMIGVWLSGTILVISNLITAYFAIMPWLVRPGGAWDQDVLAGISALAFVGTGLAIVTVLLTVILVAAKWQGKWWFIVPAALFVLAVTRLVYIGTAYPELPDNYGASHPSIRQATEKLFIAAGVLRIRGPGRRPAARPGSGPGCR